MKLYKELATIPVFTLLDVKHIIKNGSLASKKINALIKEGSVHRIKRDLYTCVNFAIEEDCANRFDIASRISENSFISFHSALEFYGFYNQMYFDVQVSGLKRFENFSYDYYNYKSFITDSLNQIEMIKGVRVTSIERTIVDCINMLGKVLDAEELVKCLDLVHSINEKKILEMLGVYNKEILYRKVGYILSFYKNDLNISDSFFSECKKKGKKSNKGCLIHNDKNALSFNSEWGIYAYDNIRNLSFKGGDLCV